ncbi:Secondary metabolism regulator LAE1 [Colletotrichum siamense]|uniref:Secondary metabolism regulator LAE1 n=1 Tax=Colletotrichum siamense TaxID=690259 RepID=UPI001872D7C8|nr:Secondary metabolism regulator LAE1 [Colletotrichum siamense]KAF5501407.1 Secondary metabolism regulator LAE1 [Colletotrichum siamense]
MRDSTKAQSTSPRTVATNPKIAAQQEGQSTHTVVRPAGSMDDDDEVLQANDPEEDGPSVIDNGQLSSYTASLASSAVDYPVEYGRRYHAFRPGSYIMPNDEYEMDRMDFAHAMLVRAVGNKLYTAPLEKNKVNQILDIGTGTGIWAMEMGDVFENAEVTGVDLSAIQPEWVGPNVKFVVDDVESQWVGDKKYDYIFCRCMAACVADWPKLIRTIYDNLNPGGWVEFQDSDFNYYSDDGTLTEKHQFKQWSKSLVSALESIGRDPCPGPKLKGWVKDAGFQEISHKRLKVPVGPWPKDQWYRDLGAMNLTQLLNGLEGFSMRVFCGILGQTESEVQALLDAVRKELRTRHLFHAQLDFHVIYGQKSLESEE